MRIINPKDHRIGDKVLRNDNNIGVSETEVNY